MMRILAETAAGGPNDMVSLGALGTFILGIGGMIITWLKRNDIKGQGAREERERKITIDGQPISFTTSSPNVTHLELGELKRDMDMRFTKIEAALSEERSAARVALGKIHARLDSGAVATAEMKGELNAISDNVDRILDIMMNPNKPRPRP